MCASHVVQEKKLKQVPLGGVLTRNGLSWQLQTDAVLTQLLKCERKAAVLHAVGNSLQTLGNPITEKHTANIT